MFHCVFTDIKVTAKFKDQIYSMVTLLIQFLRVADISRHFFSFVLSFNEAVDRRHNLSSVRNHSHQLKTFPCPSPERPRRMSYMYRPQDAKHALPSPTAKQTLYPTLPFPVLSRHCKTFCTLLPLQNKKTSPSYKWISKDSNT